MRRAYGSRSSSTLRARSRLRAAAALTTLLLLACARGAPATDSGGQVPAPVAARPSKGCALTSLATGRRIEQTISVGGVERRYILDVPESLQPGAPAALLFDFHGVGHSGSGLWEVSGFREIAPRERFITVYPDGLPVSFTRGERTFSGPGWEIRTFAQNRDIDFTIALLDQLESTYCIDRARVFSTGFSNGGYFSHVLGCTHADRFAAVAPVSGGWLATWSCKPERPIPVLIHHGRQDDVIDVAEERLAYRKWLEIDGCAPDASPSSTPDATGMSCAGSSACRDGVAVTYCEGDFAHRWPASATARVWDFFKAHPLPAAK